MKNLLKTYESYESYNSQYNVGMNRQIRIKNKKKEISKLIYNKEDINLEYYMEYDVFKVFAHYKGNPHIIIGQKIIYTPIFGHFDKFNDNQFLYVKHDKDKTFENIDKSKFYMCDYSSIVKNISGDYLKFQSYDECKANIDILRKLEYERYQEFIDEIAKNKLYEYKENPNNYNCIYEYVDPNMMAFDINSEIVKVYKEE